MTIDWNNAFLKTLRAGKFPQRERVKSALQWIDKRLVVSTHGFHRYCYYSKDRPEENQDLEKIETCMIEIINSAAFVLKETRDLKEKRMERK